MKNYLLNTYEDPFFGLFDLKQSNLLRSDIKETDENYIIEVEVPGIKKEDISISYEDEYITVKASYKKEENVKYLHSERFITSSFSRSYYVGNIKEDSISASFDNGLLKINIDKNAVIEQKAKTIKIQ